MAFHYRSAPWTSNLLLIAVAAVLIGIGSTEASQQLWARAVGELHPQVLLTGGFMVLHTVIFWPLALAFHVVDRTDMPAFISKHRIQSGKRRQPPLDRTIRVLVRNQFLILPVLLFALGQVMMWRGWRPEAELPSLGILVLEVVGQGVLGILVFYAGHRLLHRKWWVKRVHRVHHEFRTTTALASEYAHPFEFVVGNFGALAAGALILLPHLASMYLFAVIALLSIIVHHSGYALPWAFWSVPHDWHHYRFVEMFGSEGALDRWLGTSREYDELKDGDVR